MVKSATMTDTTTKCSICGLIYDCTKPPPCRSEDGPAGPVQAGAVGLPRNVLQAMGCTLALRPEREAVVGEQSPLAGALRQARPIEGDDNTPTSTMPVRIRRARPLGTRYRVDAGKAIARRTAQKQKNKNRRREQLAAKSRRRNR